MPGDGWGVAQWALFAIGTLGFSAAPWITALLTGRLRPLSWVKEQLADKDAQIETWKAVAATQTSRADHLAGQLAEIAGETGQTAVHLLKSLPGGGSHDDAAIGK